MIYWCLLNGYILISLIQQTLQPSVTAVAVQCKDAPNKQDGLKTIVCVRDYNPVATFIQNNTIPYDVQALYFAECAFLMVEWNSLSDYFPNLKKIVMRNTYFLDRSYGTERAPDWYTNMLKMFFASTKIVEVNVIACRLQDEDNLTYPSTLRVLDLSKNEYHVIDIRGYEELETVNVAGNQLESLPRFNNPALSIRHLNLDNNSLSNLTVDDFAPLCGLNSLQMNPSVKSFLRTKEGMCECIRIKNWTMEVNITLTGLVCDVDRHGIADCSNYTLDEARKIRQKCFTLDEEVPHIVLVVKRYSYRILSVVVLLFVTVVALYRVYKIYASSRAKKSQSRGTRSTTTSSISPRTRIGR